MTIVEFLLARIAEDEELARRGAPRVGHRRWPMITGGVAAENGDQFVGAPEDVSAHISAWSPQRVLAECEAKRRIIDEHIFFDALDHPYRGHIEASYCVSCRVQGPCPTLRALATVYAEHAKYDEAWAC